MRLRSRYLHLRDALDFVEEEALEEVHAIYIEPPDTNVVTDEDSGDEDGGLVDNLSGRQLRSKAEVVFTRSRQSVDDGESDSESDLDDPAPKIKKGDKGSKNLPGSVRTASSTKTKGNSSKRTKSSDKCRFTWKKGKALSENNNFFPEADYSDLRNRTAVDVFELFFGDEVIELLTLQSNQYALFLNNPSPNITREEMKVFLAILILSGYNTVPDKRQYWEESGDVRNDLVFNSMRRNRFLEIQRYLHCADNTNPNLADKFWKLRPLIDLVQKGCRAQFRAESNLDYDESMIAYYGFHGCKQFIRGKPIRFGYKVWCLNTPSGYLVDLEAYQGARHQGNPEYEERYGKAAAPMITMMDNLRDDVKKLPYNLFFDNLFTGMNLLEDLRSRGCNGTGTIRENRLPKNCTLSDKKSFGKEARGTYEFCSDAEASIILVRWVDNGVVTAASTRYGIEPVSKVNRYSSAEKKKVAVSRPRIIEAYNDSMGGTDLMDRGLNRYRIGVRSKKWWWPIFSWLVDVCIHNSWVLMRKAGVDVSQLEVRRQIVQAYLGKYGVLPQQGRRNFNIAGRHAGDILRYDGISHFIVPTSGGSRRRCAGDYCNSQTRSQCVKCNVGLCVPCFLSYHTQ